MMNASERWMRRDTIDVAGQRRYVLGMLGLEDTFPPVVDSRINRVVAPRGSPQPSFASYTPANSILAQPVPMPPVPMPTATPAVAAPPANSEEIDLGDL